VKIGDDYRPADLGHFFVLLKQLICVCQQPRFTDQPPSPTAGTDAKAAPVSPAAGDSKQVVTLATSSFPNIALLPLSRSANDLLLGAAPGEFIPKLLASATGRRKAKFVNSIFAHVCWENLTVSHQVVNVVEQGLKDNDYDGIRCYFRTLMRLVTLKDSLLVKRVDLVCKRLMAVIHAQSKYWKITDFCLEHLIRMAKKSPEVYQWLNGSKPVVDNIINWLTQWQQPPTRDDPNGPVLLKPQHAGRPAAQAGAGAGAASAAGDLADPLQAQMARATRANAHLYGNGAESSFSATATGLLPAKKAEALALIRDGKPLDNENCTDSDVDFSERTFKFGEYVDCLDCVNKWVIAQIVRVDGHRVEIHYDGWSDKWNETLDVADQRVRPLGSKCTKEQVANVGKKS